MIVYFYLDENPTATAQEKGTTVLNGRVHHYTKMSIREMRSLYNSKIYSFMREHNLKPPKLKGPVAVGVVFGFAIKDRKKWGTMKATKPDCDNLVKLLLDVLADMDFFEVGDQQVSLLHIYKVWSEKPYIHFTIKEVNDDILRVQR